MTFTKLAIEVLILITTITDFNLRQKSHFRKKNEDLGRR